MINILDLRAQVSPASTRQREKSGADGDAFATVFGEAKPGDAAADDVGEESWAQQGMSSAPTPRPGAVAPGDSQPGAGVRDGTDALVGNGSDTADLGRDVASPLIARPQQAQAMFQDMQQSDPAPVAIQSQPQDMGPDSAPLAAAAPKGDGLQVSVTVTAAAMPAAAMVMPMSHLIGSGLVPNSDPEDEGITPALPAKALRAVSVQLTANAVAQPEQGQEKAQDPSEGLDGFTLDEADFPSPAAVGSNTVGPGAGATSVANPVTAAVIAAIPAASAGTDRVELTLSPEELGRVQMEFRADGDEMRVFLTAERPETLDLLRRHADQLAAELRQAGYSGASLSFGAWGQPQGEARHAGQNGPVLRAESQISIPADAFQSRNVSAQGLDLRV